MARLECQKRLGYYPAHPIAIDALVQHLYPRPPDPTKKSDAVCILDPCCGKGEAINQIAQRLQIPGGNVYTVELDPERGKAVQELIPDGHHISPATFHGCQITGGSFGLAYVNPPFDNEIGGKRREEQAFCQAATPLLAAKGILVLICPIHALAGSGGFVDYLDANYEDIQVYRFPDGVDHEGRLIRNYKEIAVIGRKRKTVLPRDNVSTLGRLNQMQMRWRDYFQIDSLPQLGECAPLTWTNGQASRMNEPELHRWEIPHSWRPHTFKKSMFTDEELNQVLAESPLNQHFTEVRPLVTLEAPLSLDRGHLGLILASGVLDGIVRGPHGSHVVRGSSSKKQYLDHEATVSTQNNETGAVTTTETYRERMITTIRCAVTYPKPELFTFSNDNKSEKAEHVEAED
jgi:hypothetical protein